MPFVNKKLGNAFRIRSIDSTRDQEHYFGGAVKEISLVIQAHSGTVPWLEGNNFSLTGSTSLTLSWSLTDNQHAPIDSGGFSVRNFGVNPDDPVIRQNAKLSFKVSASDATFDIADFDFSFKDKNSSDWESYKELTITASFSVPDDDGFREFSFPFKGSGKNLPIISLNSASTDTFFLLENSANIYVYKDISLEYQQSLTNDGVEYYKEINNQNVAFVNINRNLMPKVPPEILADNSSSFGARTLAFSLGYLSASLGRFALQNVSEFPHSSGIFQMKNLVLGTTDSGKIGNTEDNIIQINYFGSVVKILWPKQSNQEAAVKGFGDFAAGQKPGKLSTQFEPGDFIDVTEFDHMSLYCYVLKTNSGTLDNIDVQIERRPLRSVGFANEQAITYSASGSTTTVAELKDLVYRKQVDYGDLSIREISYPIDFPLTNVKEVRISAKHITGQSDDENKNFVVWGRFITDEET